MATYADFGGFNTYAVGTSIHPYGLVGASCGYNSYPTAGVYRSEYSVDWPISPVRGVRPRQIIIDEFTAEVEPDKQKRNPNGYRQRKLKAKLNQMK